MIPKMPTYKVDYLVFTARAPGALLGHGSVSGASISAIGVSKNCSKERTNPRQVRQIFDSGWVFVHAKSDAPKDIDAPTPGVIGCVIQLIGV